MSLELYYIRQTVTECRAKEVVRLEKAKSENDLVVQGIAGGAKLAYEDVLRRIETRLGQIKREQEIIELLED